MMPRIRLAWAAVAAVVLVAGSARSADLSSSLQKGTPYLKSVGPLAFGPEGILFIGDPQGAAIFAVATGDQKNGSGSGPLRVEAIDGKIASLLGTTEKDLIFNDLVVNPASGNAYLSISRGKGPSATPVVMRVNHEGKIDELVLKDVPFAKAAIPNPASGRSRQVAITKIAYVDGRVFVAGLSSEDFSSQLRAIPFPFTEVGKGTSVEIYHGSHAKFETKSPVRTFAPYKINGEDQILAAYTCTPLVKIPVADLKPGAHVKGTTVAELGNHNNPLDMIVYQKDGKDYVLMSNSSRGLMKISLVDLDKAQGITKPVSNTAGLTYDTITSIKGVLQLDRLDKENALVLLRAENGTFGLDTIALP
jgi:hypothetical protein